MIRVPSVKTLREAFAVDPTIARIIRQILKGQVDPCSASTAALRYKRDCFNPPRDYLLKLTAINQLLDLHGVEYVPQGANRRSPGFHYLNTGETYTPTLIRINGGGYRVSSWGDIVERGNYA